MQNKTKYRNSLVSKSLPIKKRFFVSCSFSIKNKIDYVLPCAKTNDVNGANTALKIVRKRAGLADKTFAQSDLMLEIEHQCLLEFFGEGHRFDDLKRWYTTEEIKDIFTENEKQGAEYFQEKHKYYPIPSGELNNNDAMVQTELWR